MGFEKYNNFKNKKKRDKKLLIFLVFSFVMGIILLTTFYGNFSFTGKTISSININNSVNLSSELTVPELKLKGDYNQIIIIGKSNSFFYIGDKKFSLNENAPKEIILNGFSGKIYFDKDKIFLMDGKISGVILNGIPISGKNNKKLKLYADSEISYNSIEFKESLYLKEINYISSGEIYFDEGKKDKVVLNEDKLFVSHFLGQLKIIEKKMILNGLVDRVDIKNKNRKISISY